MAYKEKLNYVSWSSNSHCSFIFYMSIYNKVSFLTLLIILYLLTLFFLRVTLHNNLNIFKVPNKARNLSEGVARTRYTLLSECANIK